MLKSIKTLKNILRHKASGGGMSVRECAPNNYIASEITHSLDKVLKHCAIRCLTTVGCDIGAIMITPNMDKRLSCLAKARELLQCLMNCADTYRLEIAQLYNVTPDCVTMLWETEYAERLLNSLMMHE
jgi:hypothetical protein